MEYLVDTNNNNIKCKSLVLESKGPMAERIAERKLASGETAVTEKNASACSVNTSILAVSNQFYPSQQPLYHYSTPFLSMALASSLLE
jgi:hypothetical protein